MKVLGCDCSTKLIASVMLDDGLVLTNELRSSASDANERSLALFDGFRELLDHWDSIGLLPDIVYIEQAVYLQNIKTTLTIDSVINAVKFCCFMKEIPYVIIDNKAWKKDVLGNGKASKEQIMEFAKAKWNDNITTQDVADASCIALYGVRRINA